MNNFRGRIWKFGDNISTDLLMPSLTMYEKVPRDKMKNYCLRAVRPEFPEQARPGDILVAGRNFACGSSRPALNNIIDLGLACVVVESCGDIFFRNAISSGYPVIICPGITGVCEDGDIVGISMDEGWIVNQTSGKFIRFEKYPPFLQRVIDKGGILEMFRQDSDLEDLE